jgi:hypothetical protein
VVSVDVVVHHIFVQPRTFIYVILDMMPLPFLPFVYIAISLRLFNNSSMCFNIGSCISFDGGGLLMPWPPPFFPLSATAMRE